MLRKGAWCEIDLKQFQANLQILKSVANTQALLVVKANAYGHGIEEIVVAADKLKIMTMFAVATLDEAQRVASTGTSTPILVIAPVMPEEVHVCLENGWQFFVGSKAILDMVTAYVKTAKKKPKVHIKIDTGMGRAGVQPEQFSDFFEACSKASDIEFEGIATHFASADLQDESYTLKQLEIFTKAIEMAKQAGITPRFIHAANSPAVLRFPMARFNLVRLGVLAYGLKPDSWMALPQGIASILCWKAKIARLQLLPPGHGISYGSEYVTSQSELVATIPVGYADGFRRITGINTILYKGHELPILGRICMDQVVARMPQALQAQIGDEVVLLGKSQDKQITADDLASRWNTNSYEVLTGISPRVPRVYV